LLLPLLYAQREFGSAAEYNQAFCRQAISEFLNQSKAGQDSYDEGVRLFARHLYSTIVSRDPATYFLDKTPRYHMVSEDILRIFPDAKYVFLWRNPLAIVASLVNSWCGGNFLVHRYRKDLEGGLFSLIDAYGKTDNAVSVRYEDLVAEPEATLDVILSYLGLHDSASILQAFAQADVPGRMGDSNARQISSFQSESLTGWKSAMNTPIRRWWCKRYLDRIGKSRLGEIGYDIHDLKQELEESPTNFARIIPDLYYLFLRPSVDIAIQVLRDLKLKNLTRYHW
jgi:hypothetical protein